MHLLRKVTETQQVAMNRSSNNVTEGMIPSQSTQNASENNDTELEQSCPEES